MRNIRARLDRLEERLLPAGGIDWAASYAALAEHPEPEPSDRPRPNLYSAYLAACEAVPDGTPFPDWETYKRAYLEAGPDPLEHIRESENPLYPE